MKKLVALLCTITLVFGMLPVVYADESSGAAKGLPSIEGQILYRLSEDAEVQAGIPDPVGYTKIFQDCGSKLSTVDNNGSKSLLVTRDSDAWRGVDIKTSAIGLEAGKDYQYTIAGRAEGSSVSMSMQLGAQQQGGAFTYYTESAVTADGSFVIQDTKEFTSDDFIRINSTNGSTDIVSFIIDEIVISDVNGDKVVIRGEEIFRMSTDDPDVASDAVSQGWTEYFMNAGSTLSAVTNESGGKSIKVATGGADSWRGVDIRTESLDIELYKEYQYTIIGHMDMPIPDDMIINVGTKSGAQTKGVNVDPNTGKFAVQNSIIFDGVLDDVRINTNKSAEISFIIDEMVVSVTGNEIDPPLDSSGEFWGSHVFYDLSADPNAQAVGSFTTAAPLKQSGDPTISVVDYQDGKSLLLSDRTENYFALDVVPSELKVNDEYVGGIYTIHVTGHIANDVDIPEDSSYVVIGDGGNYTELVKQTVSNDNRSFDLTLELTLTGTQVAARNSFRVQTSASLKTANFYIDSLVVDVYSPVSLTFTFDQKDFEKYGAWWKGNDSVDLEWVSNFGDGDKYSLMATHKEGTGWGATANGINLRFPTNLPAGQYRIKASYYVPKDTHNLQYESTISEPCLLLNGQSGDAINKLPNPDNMAPTVLDKWVYVDELTIEDYPSDISFIDFRFYARTGAIAECPDKYYLDSVSIEQLAVSESDSWDDPEWNLSLSSLKDKYSAYFPIGNIMSPGDLNDGYGTTDMYLKHYNLITAENAMKPVGIESTKGSKTYEAADTIVAWAEKNKLPVHGHTLVWHAQSPAWLNEGLTREQARTNMRNYINDVAGHYAGKVISWDVVNEAFADGGGEFEGNDWRSVLRTASPWYTAYQNGADASKGEDGSDYIYDAFVFTRLVDSNAVLYYNDFNEELPSKRDAIALMVEELNTKWKSDENYDGRLLIEGIGMQSHHWVASFNADNVDAAIKRFIQTGAKVGITELDIPYGAWNNQHNSRKLTEEQEIEQAVMYAKLFVIYKKYASNISRVTLWGKADVQSWRSFGMPLLFDNSFRAKEAYYAVMDPEAYLSEHDPDYSNGSSVSQPAIPSQPINASGEASSLQFKLTSGRIYRAYEN